MSRYGYLLQMAVEYAKRDPRWRGDMLMAAVARRSDGLHVFSRNVQVRAQQTPAGHAEYRLHSKLTSGSVVAVARVTRDGEWANAAPCKKCRTVLKNMGVRLVLYTIGPGETGELRL